MDDFITKEEFRKLWEEQMQLFRKMWEDQRRENHTFWNTSDITLRNIEFQVSQMKIMVETFNQMFIDKRAGDIRIEAKIDKLEETIQMLELGLEVTKGDADDISKALYGDATRPDAPTSIMRMIQSRSDKADVQHEELLQSISALNDRIEGVEEFVLLRKKIEQYAITGVKKGVELFTGTTKGRIGLILIGSAVFLKVFFPQQTDAFFTELAQWLTSQP